MQQGWMGCILRWGLSSLGCPGSHPSCAVSFTNRLRASCYFSLHMQTLPLMYITNLAPVGIEFGTRHLELGFPGVASGKEPACQCRRHKRHWFDPWVGKILWRRKWQPTPVFLPGESHGQMSLVGCSPWGCK